MYTWHARVWIVMLLADCIVKVGAMYMYADAQVATLNGWPTPALLAVAMRIQRPSCHLRDAHVHSRNERAACTTRSFLPNMHECVEPKWRLEGSPR